MVDDPLKKGAKTQALAISFQVHDKTRPAYEEHTDLAVVAGHNQRIAALQHDGFFDYFGDIVQGVRSALLVVAEVHIDIAKSIVNIVVQLADGTLAAFSGLFQMSKEAAQAVEAVFVSVGAQIADVIDYFSWLFDFKDVWLSKKALENGLNQVFPWILKVVEFARKNGDDWFIGKETEVTAAFEAMKQVFGGKLVGGLQANPRIQGESAPSEAGKTKELVGSSHVHWLSEHFQQAVQTPEAWKHVAGPQGNPFDVLQAAIGNSPAWAEFELAFNGLESLFTNLFSGGDPSTLASLEIVTLLDIFEHLTLAALKFGNAIFDAILDFITAMVNTVNDYLNAPINIPLLQTVYDFIQGQAGVDAKDYEKLTFLHMGALSVGFVGTIAFKAVFQKTPFPAGTVIPIFPTTGKPEAQPDPGPHVIWPDFWGIQMPLQFFGSAMMIFDGFFDTVVNATTSGGDVIKFSPLFYKASAVNHMFAYGLLDCPWVWGTAWPSDGVTEFVNWCPLLMWGMSAVANGIDVGCAFENGYFVGSFEDDAINGAVAFTTLGVARILMSAVRYQYGSDVGTPTGILNCSINVTSFFSAATGFVRLIYKKNPEAGLFPLVLKGVLDIVCDAFAGGASVGQIIYELHNPPKFDVPTSFTARVNVPFSHQLTGEDGFAPYDWTLHSTGQPLPTWLAVNADTGLLSGTPTAPGTFQFSVWLGDDYGPTVYYTSGFVNITVT